MSAQVLPVPPGVNYLCVEGVIGVGKTSFCTLLGHKFAARLILETAEENPFLRKFYDDRRALAFQTQLWFLLSRFRQLTEAVAQQDLFHPVTVGDYFFEKDRIFASINLEPEEFALYDQVASVMAGRTPQPDLVIYLQASTDILLRRIECRGRPYEFNIDPHYIAALNEAYNRFFFHYSASPLLIINTDEIDFVNVAGDFDDLVEQIAKTKSGTNFYRPMTASDKARLHGRPPAGHHSGTEPGDKAEEDGA